jgi:hypothetical protein
MLNLSELLANTSNIIIAHIIQAFFVLAFDWLTLAEDDSIGRNNAKVARIGFHYLFRNDKISCKEKKARSNLIITLNSTARMPPRTRKRSSLRTGR